MLSVLGRSLCYELISRPEGPTDCAALLCVKYKPRECGGPGPLGAVVPETNKVYVQKTSSGRRGDGWELS